MGDDSEDNKEDDNEDDEEDGKDDSDEERDGGDDSEDVMKIDQIFFLHLWLFCNVDVTIDGNPCLM